MPAARNDTLVEKEFWETEYYWATVQPPIRPDLDMPFDRSMASALERLAPATADDRVLEVGCAPAKWLGFYGTRFGSHVEGIEYSEKGAAAVPGQPRRPEGVRRTIHHADFFHLVPVTQYDLVLSFGFIEHFDDRESLRPPPRVRRPEGHTVRASAELPRAEPRTPAFSDPSNLALHNLRARGPRALPRPATVARAHPRCTRPT